MTLPCNFDHNGECLICDCWPCDCAYVRFLKEDYSMESKERLAEMFKAIPYTGPVPDNAAELLEHGAQLWRQRQYQQADQENLATLDTISRLLSIKGV